MKTDITINLSVTTPFIGDVSRVVLSDLVDGVSSNGPFTWANKFLDLRFKNIEGDCVDKSGIPQGLDAFSKSQLITSAGIYQMDVTDLTKKLLTDNTGFFIRAEGGKGQVSSNRGTAGGPTLRVVTDAGSFDCQLKANTYVWPGSGGFGNTDIVLSPPFMLSYDLSAVAGNILSATLTLNVVKMLTARVTFAAYFLDMPVIHTDPAKELGNVEDGIAQTVAKDSDLASHPSVVVYDEFSSGEEIKKGQWVISSRFPTGPNDPNGFTTNPVFEEDKVKNIWMLRAEVPAGTNSGIRLKHIVYPKNMHKYLTDGWGNPGQVPNPLYPSPPYAPWAADFGDGPTDLYWRYVIKIDPDIINGQTDGIKLPGLAGDYNVVSSTDPAYTLLQGSPNGRLQFNARTEITRPAPSMPLYFRPFIYLYDWEVLNVLFPDGGTGQPIFADNNIVMKAGQTYSVEQHIKLNTWNGTGNPEVYDRTGNAWNQDGVLQLWIDGVRCIDIRNRKIRSARWAVFNEIPWFEVYHGGTAPPTANIHIWVGANVVSREYIGPVK